jgi:hypothetical protein
MTENELKQSIFSSDFYDIHEVDTKQLLEMTGTNINYFYRDETNNITLIEPTVKEKLIDEILIKTIFSIVTFFTDYFRESLKIKNIRKMFFLFSLSITMMSFLFIMNTFFPFPVGIPTSIL